MRDFKFRVWDIDHNCMTNNIGIDKIYLYDFKGDNITEQEGLVIMQYTGLKDKNGKEIFEGDEFQAGKSKGFIKYYADSFEIEWYHNPENWNEHLRHHVTYGEVTGGHIHDTPTEVSP